jgi:hypothetical protein
VILFALLMPVAMMALLFGLTALEERLFPQPSVTEDAGPPAAPSAERQGFGFVQGQSAPGHKPW